jgi:hypothetical protein
LLPAPPSGPAVRQAIAAANPRVPAPNTVKTICTHPKLTPAAGQIIRPAGSGCFRFGQAVNVSLKSDTDWHVKWGVLRPISLIQIQDL